MTSSRQPGKLGELVAMKIHVESQKVLRQISKFPDAVEFDGRARRF
jgi:hypothetical protein